MVDDAQRLQAWQAGDAAAGQDLFRRHFTSIYRFFRNKLDGEVDDLVQQTFMRCARATEGFRGESSFRTFLFSIARRVLADHFRGRHRPGRDEPLEDRSVVDLGTSPSDVLARKHEHRLLLRALRSMPLHDQIALELYYWEQLTGAEVGQVLGVPENTARTRLRRARLELTRRIDALAEDTAARRSTVDDLERWAASVREALAPDEA